MTSSNKWNRACREATVLINNGNDCLYYHLLLLDNTHVYAFVVLAITAVVMFAMEALCLLRGTSESALKTLSILTCAVFVLIAYLFCNALLKLGYEVLYKLVLCYLMYDIPMDVHVLKLHDRALLTMVLYSVNSMCLIKNTDCYEIECDLFSYKLKNASDRLPDFAHPCVSKHQLETWYYYKCSTKCIMS